MAVPPTSADRKASLRHIFRSARRAQVGSIERADGLLMEAALAGHLMPLLSVAEVVASYAAYGPEMDPAAADDQAAILAFPRVAPDDRMTFHACPRAMLIEGRFGIPAPPEDAPEVTPDLVLVPLLAATLAGDRLGQGKGHYDRALARLRDHGPVVAVGIAWPVQVVADLPCDAWDQRLDWLATPSGLMRCGDASIGDRGASG